MFNFPSLKCTLIELKKKTDCGSVIEKGWAKIAWKVRNKQKNKQTSSVGMSFISDKPLRMFTTSKRLWIKGNFKQDWKKSIKRKLKSSFKNLRNISFCFFLIIKKKNYARKNRVLDLLLILQTAIENKIWLYCFHCSYLLMCKYFI